MSTPAASLTLRPGTADDADRLLAWRNDPTTRAMSGDTGEIDRATHVAWLGRRLADPDTRLFIAEAGGEAAGYVRFDGRDGGGCEVSIALAPDHRGQGLARPMLGEGCRLIRAERPQRPITARVRPGNAASNRLFLACGFIEVGHDDQMIHYALP